MHVHLVELEAMQNVSLLQNAYTAFTLNSQEDENPGFHHHVDIQSTIGMNHQAFNEDDKTTADVFWV
jgi:hypothetical protein